MLLSQKWVVVTLALIGAVMVTAASLLAPRGTPVPSGRAVSSLLSRIGYGLTFASIVLFIVAGFLSGR